MTSGIFDEQDETRQDNAERAGEIAALIARLEAATGPDRELDAVIFAALRPGSVIINGFIMDKFGFCKPAPCFTGSIDAARTMIPAGKYWLLAEGRTQPDEPLGAAVIVEPNASQDKIAESEAATVELALCAAALKAIEALK